MFRHRVSVSVLTASILTLVIACAPGPPTETPTDRLPSEPATPSVVEVSAMGDELIFDPSIVELTGRVAIDGSSTVFPITELAAVALAPVAPEIDVDIGVSGSGGGFKKFCAGETDVSDASRPIKASEQTLCETNGVRFVEVPIAFDGLSVVVHPENDWANCMTVDDLRRIWRPEAESTVVSWHDVRPSWPARPLVLYAPGRDSGTFDYFTSAIVGEEGTSRDDFRGSEDDYKLAQGVAADPGALGFFGYAYYEELADNLGLVAIDGGDGCVRPDETTINDGSYQPLSRPLFLYLSVSALERPAVRAFVDFYLDNAERFVRQAGYATLPPRAYPLAKRRVAARATGSMFEGGSQVGISIEELLQTETESTPETP